MRKHVVFDLDETIGFFKQFIYIINIVEQYRQVNYNDYFGLFIKCFRPNIFEIFHNLLLNKKLNNIKYIILYTNNNNTDFIHKVIHFINNKMDDTLFDYIIPYNHTNRTTHSKSYTDLLNCIDSIDNDIYCFIDDKIHPNMTHKMVSNIKCEKYSYHYDIENVLTIIFSHDTYLRKYRKNIKTLLKKYSYSKRELPIHIHEYSGKKLFNNIEIFVLTSV